ncbi:RuvB-like 2 [Ramicandelaber brevisporus]|nr:RuvB-like 2 [Ramicandelaber brevisporus]
MDSILPSSAETRELSKLERTGAHSHIRGLGLDDRLQPLPNQSGMVGMANTRKAAGVVVRLIKEGKIRGRPILLAGPPASGKTAVAMAIAQELGSDVPFTSISGSEIYSLGMSKTEALTQALRRAIAIRITETTELIEAEVVELQVDRSLTGLGKKTGKMTLKTTDMETIYDMGEKLIDSMAKEKITAGDVVSIDRSNGRVSRIGRSFSRARDFDAAGPDVKFVSCPEGEIQKKRTKVHSFSLHEADAINCRKQGFLAIFSGDTGEINSEVRDQVDKGVRDLHENNRCEIVPGVLFIDEVHMLDIECFSFLNAALETEKGFAPIVIVASNRGFTKVRGTNYVEPHGIPSDFRERALTIMTQQLSLDEVRQVLKNRLDEESTEMSPDAIEVLTRIALETSIRYAIHLIATASLVAQRRKSAVVDIVDIKKVYSLFMDQKRSAQSLQDNNLYMYNSAVNVNNAVIQQAQQQHIQQQLQQQQQQQQAIPNATFMANAGTNFYQPQPQPQGLPQHYQPQQ